MLIIPGKKLPKIKKLLRPLFPIRLMGGGYWGSNCCPESSSSSPTSSSSSSGIISSSSPSISSTSDFTVGCLACIGGFTPNRILVEFNGISNSVCLLCNNLNGIYYVNFVSQTTGPACNYSLNFPDICLNCGGGTFGYRRLDLSIGLSAGNWIITVTFVGGSFLKFSWLKNYGAGVPATPIINCCELVEEVIPFNFTTDCGGSLINPPICNGSTSTCKITALGCD